MGGTGFGPTFGLSPMTGMMGMPMSMPAMQMGMPMSMPAMQMGVSPLSLMYGSQQAGYNPLLALQAQQGPQTFLGYPQSFSRMI